MVFPFSDGQWEPGEGVKDTCAAAAPFPVLLVVCLCRYVMCVYLKLYTVYIYLPVYPWICAQCMNVNNTPSLPWPLSCKYRETIVLCSGLSQSCMFLFLVKRTMCVSSLCSLTEHIGPVCESGAAGTLEAQEWWAVLLWPMQAFTPGDKHVLPCQERTRSRLSLSPVDLKGKHPLHFTLYSEMCFYTVYCFITCRNNTYAW